MDKATAEMPTMATLTASTIAANTISSGVTTDWYDGGTYISGEAIGWGKPLNRKGDSIMKAKDEVRKRLVFVAVVDAHPDLDDVASVVYLSDAPIVTSDTDQEIWMGLDIKRLLALHNDTRVKVLDKEASRAAGRDIYLEPARIRDLCMAVIPLATFD